MDFCNLVNCFSNKKFFYIKAYKEKKQQEIFINKCLDRIKNTYEDIYWLSYQPYKNLQEYITWSEYLDELQGNRFNLEKCQQEYQNEIEPIVNKHKLVVDKLFTNNHDRDFNLGFISGFLMALEYRDKLSRHYDTPLLSDNKQLGDEYVVAFSNLETKEKEIQNKTKMLINASPLLVEEFGFGFCLSHE